MKRLLKYVLICLVAALIPFAAFIAVGESVNNNYENVFTASLVDKYERLCAVEGKKIVFVGGSSLPFGLKCELIESELNMKAVDMGVYAALGTKAVMEVSLKGISAGDVVVLAPELNAQTYSLYFNADAMWEAVDTKREIITLLDYDEKVDMAYNYFDHLYDRIRISGDAGVSDGELYARSSFDEYGDIDYVRRSNIMAGGYDKSQPITLDIFDERFISYVNEYVKKVQNIGAKVYFTFSPTNALAAEFSYEEAKNFEWDLEDSLICGILGGVDEFTYEPQYFYNTNYHLNDRGALLHTANLIRLLKAEMGIDTPTDIVIPAAEEDDEMVFGEDENEKYFFAEAVGGVLCITGVKEGYRGASQLTLPVSYGGKKVVGISSRCFAGCENLQKLTVPDNYRIFDVEIFVGCGRLKEIYLLTENPGATSIPDSGMFTGAAEGLKVYVKATEYTNFISSYSWSKYKEYIYKF